MLNSLWKIIRLLIVLTGVITILLPLLAGITLILWIVDIPRKVGSYLTFESAIREMLFRVFDPDEMRDFRDDVLHIVESEIEEEEEWERWGLLREMETAQDEIGDILKDGEFAFTFVGGVAALVIGNVFGITYGGVFLTLVGLLFSLLVAARIIITDALCYRSINHRHDSLRRLAILKAWNRGPIFGTGGIGVAILSLFASWSEEGYQIGIKILEITAELKFEGEDKWRVE